MTEEILIAAKMLPRREDGAMADSFEANGSTYRWLDISEIGIEAWTGLSNLMDVFFSGQDSLAAVHAYHKKTAVDAMAITDINKLKYHISTRTQNYLDGIVNKTEQRYHLSMHIAAILTLKEGDDIRGYSSERSEAYVADWVKEGYSHIDFFTIAGNLSVEFRKSYRQTQARILEVDRLTKAASATKPKGEKL